MAAIEIILGENFFVQAVDNSVNFEEGCDRYTSFIKI
jgi:hypothetical protein